MPPRRRRRRRGVERICIEFRITEPGAATEQRSAVAPGLVFVLGSPPQMVRFISMRIGLLLSSRLQPSPDHSSLRICRATAEGLDGGDLTVLFPEGDRRTAYVYSGTAGGWGTAMGYHQIRFRGLERILPHSITRESAPCYPRPARQYQLRIYPGLGFELYQWPGGLHQRPAGRSERRLRGRKGSGRRAGVHMADYQSTQGAAKVSTPVARLYGVGDALSPGVP